MDIGTLEKTYRELEGLTQHFKKMRPDLLQQDPRRILVFRLLLGLRQEEAKKIFSPSICDYEYGRYKKMKPGKASKVMEKIAQEFVAKNVRPSSNLLRQNFKRFNGLREEILKKGMNALSSQMKAEVKIKIRKSIIRSIESGKYDIQKALATRAARERETEQEQTIRYTLEKTKMKFQQHVYIGNVNVDFAIPNAENPTAAIMATVIGTRKYSFKCLLIERLALRMFRLKKRLPKLKTVAVIETEYLTPSQRKLLEECCDTILLNMPFQVSSLRNVALSPSIV